MELNLLAGLGALAAGYLIGAIPVGLILGKLLKGIDVREHGSGRTGASNVLRALGTGPAVITLAADTGKGTVGVLLGLGIGSLIAPEYVVYCQALGGLAAIAGHNWPVYIGGRGGRGVATTLGAAIALSPVTASIAAIVALTTIIITDVASLGSLFGLAAGLLAAGIFLVMGYGNETHTTFFLVAGGLIVVQHRDNIQRLIRGTERRLGLRDRVRKNRQIQAD